jgi:hypothetical protein
VLPAGDDEYKEKEEAGYWMHLRNDLATSISVSADGVRMRMEKKNKKKWVSRLEGEWRASRNGG